MKIATALLILLARVATPANSAGADADHVSAGASAQTAAPQIIRVDAGKVIRRFSEPPIGIGVNHLMDSDSKRPPGSRSLASALTELGVGSLRFPEGELGDSYLWAVPPFPAKSATRPGWALRGPGFWPSNDRRFSSPDFHPLPDIMGFDAFMDVCLATRSTPFIIVAYDSAYKKPRAGSVTPTVAQLKRSAAEWVRYANITRGWNIRYWEIGNETDIVPEAHSGADPGAGQYARDVMAFSRAMKAVDPTIRIGINFCNNKRLQQLLAYPGLAGAVDFISLHNYPTFGWKRGYEVFRSGSPDLTSAIREADAIVQSAPIPSAAKSKLRFHITETNAIDWAKKNSWPNLADVDHALVQFEIIGQSLLQPRVEGVHQWVTRWIDNNEKKRPLRIYDALDPGNRLTPPGQALSVWGRFLGRNLVAAQGGGNVVAYAGTARRDRRLVVFLLNKNTRCEEVRLEIKGFSHSRLKAAQVLYGCSPKSAEMKWKPALLMPVPPATLRLDPLSITILEYGR